MEKQWQPLELVKTTTEFFAGKGVPTPRLDAEVLLCAVLECSRLRLYTLLERPLTAQELERYRGMVRRRAAREPVSRILGRREFMGLDFRVTPDVLSPRPETEILVEQALKLLSPAPKKKRSDAVFEAFDKRVREFLVENAATIRAGVVPEELARLLSGSEVTQAELLEATEAAQCATGGNLRADEPREAAEPQGVRRVLDLGTGSGCIAVALAKLAKNIAVVAGDISGKALAVARENAENHGVAGAIDFREGDFFAVCAPDERFAMIVSNPPYLVEGDGDIWPEVSGYDPAQALYAGGEGLDCYRAIAERAREFLLPGGWLLLELGAGQYAAVRELILQHSPLAEVSSLADHAGITRVLCARDL